MEKIAFCFLVVAISQCLGDFTCKPGDESICSFNGYCNRSGSSCECYTENFFSSENCHQFHDLLLPTNPPTSVSEPVQFSAGAALDLNSKNVIIVVFSVLGLSCLIVCLIVAKLTIRRKSDNLNLKNLEFKKDKKSGLSLSYLGVPSYFTTKEQANLTLKNLGNQTKKALKEQPMMLKRLGSRQLGILKEKFAQRTSSRQSSSSFNWYDIGRTSIP